MSTKTPFHSAVPSWSGYTYQGKIALFVALEQIVNIPLEDYAEYKVEFEWFEDFAILKGEKYLSIHQVKTYNRKTFSEYQDALWNLLGKTYLKKNSLDSYLHTTIQIDDLDVLKSQLLALPVPGVLSDEEKYSPSYYHKLVLESGKFEEIYMKLKKHKYPNMLYYCPLAYIEEAIKRKIEDYYQLRSEVKTEEQIKRVYSNLLELIDSYITSRHDDEQQKLKKMPKYISFDKIFDILDKNWESPSETYVKHIIRDRFHSIFEKKIAELYEFYGQKAEFARLENYLYHFNSYSLDNFFNICQWISPHINESYADLEAYRKLLTESGTDILLDCLLEVKQSLHNEKPIFLQERNNTTYLPTTINFDPSSNKSKYNKNDFYISKLAQDILANQDIHSFLYEVDNLISGYINMGSLEDAAKKFQRGPTEDSREENNITKIKSIRMIDIQRAGKELNL
ncbi:hypothetical protein D3C74_215760 [compost metagenome]